MVNKLGPTEFKFDIDGKSVDLSLRRDITLINVSRLSNPFGIYRGMRGISKVNTCKTLSEAMVILKRITPGEVFVYFGKDEKEAELLYRLVMDSWSKKQFTAILLINGDLKFGHTIYDVANILYDSWDDKYRLQYVCARGL